MDGYIYFLGEREGEREDSILRSIESSVKKKIHCERASVLLAHGIVWSVARGEERFSQFTIASWKNTSVHTCVQAI